MPILLSRRVATILFAFVLMIVQAVCAAQQRPLPSDQWYTVTEHMSPEEYREAYRHNQHLLREQVESYSTDALRSAGVPETGIRLMGVAAGLAVDGNARLYLTGGRRKGLALDFRDAVNGERSVLLGIHVKW